MRVASSMRAIVMDSLGKRRGGNCRCKGNAFISILQVFQRKSLNSQQENDSSGSLGIFHSGSFSQSTGNPIAVTSTVGYYAIRLFNPDTKCAFPFMESIQYAMQHRTAYKRLESISVWQIQLPLILLVICGVAERLRSIYAHGVRNSSSMRQYYASSFPVSHGSAD